MSKILNVNPRVLQSNWRKILFCRPLQPSQPHKTLLFERMVTSIDIDTLMILWTDSMPSQLYVFNVKVIMLWWPRSPDSHSQLSTRPQAHFVQGHNKIESMSLPNENSRAEGFWRKLWTQVTQITRNNLD